MVERADWSDGKPTSVVTPDTPVPAKTGTELAEAKPDSSLVLSTAEAEAEIAVIEAKHSRTEETRVTTADDMARSGAERLLGELPSVGVEPQAAWEAITAASPELQSLVEGIIRRQPSIDLKRLLAEIDKKASLESGVRGQRHHDEVAGWLVIRGDVLAWLAIAIIAAVGLLM
jgi:hypothetical protein